MSSDAEDDTGKAVPFRRLSRLVGVGSMAANIAGNMAVNGAKQFAAGKRPKVTDLIMTPANARKVTQQLSTMRGAAMKIGQMISMDSGDFLPKEFADILARLRSDAQSMPRAQLGGVLKSEWGEEWRSKFDHFGDHPIAAASIGQVHIASLPSGEALAIKVQYPGVKESIDSDINNVAALLRMTGLVPAHLDVKPVIEEGRRQLHEEADYIREAAYLCRFHELLSGDENFEVPTYYPELSTERILAMSYMDSQPIDDMIDATQETRNRIAALLIELLLRELFVFKVMQTDPNFANYRYDPDTRRIVLLDFGASREISSDLAAAYGQIMTAVMSGNTDAIYEQASTIGFVPENIDAADKAAILDILEIALEPLLSDEPFDFGDNHIAAQMRDKGMALAGKRELWHVPPANTVFIQRKFAGMYMLAARLRAQVNVHALMKKYTGVIDTGVIDKQS